MKDNFWNTFRGAHNNSEPTSDVDWELNVAAQIPPSEIAYRKLVATPLNQDQHQALPREIKQQLRNSTYCLIPDSSSELFRYRRDCQFWVFNKKQWYKTTFTDFKRQSRAAQRILLAPFHPKCSHYAPAPKKKKRGLTQLEIQQFFRHVPESEPIQPSVYLSYPSNGSVITFTDNKAHDAQRRLNATGSVSVSQWVNLTWEGPSSGSGVADVGKRAYMHGLMGWSYNMYLRPGKYKLTATAGQMTQVSHFEVIAEQKLTGWLKVQAYYDDNWHTPMPTENITLKIDGKVYQSSISLNTGTGVNTFSTSLPAATRTKDEAGVHVVDKMPKGAVAVEFASQTGIEQEIASLRQSIITILDGAYRDTVKSMAPFQAQWDDYGYAAIAIAGAQGLYAGADKWLEEQADLFEIETWSSIATDITSLTDKALDYAADYAHDTYIEIRDSANQTTDWVADNADKLASWNWWRSQSNEALNEAKVIYGNVQTQAQQGLTDAGDLLQHSQQTLAALITHRHTIAALPDIIAAGDVNKIQYFIDNALMDIDADFANTIKQSKHFHAVLELIADHDTALAYAAYTSLIIESVPPNFYSYVNGKGGAYLAIEVMLLIITALFTAGTGTAARASMLLAKLTASSAKAAQANSKIQHAQAAINALSKTVGDVVHCSAKLKDLGNKLMKARNKGIIQSSSNNTTLVRKKDNERRNQRCRLCKSTEHVTPRSLRGNAQKDKKYLGRMQRAVKHDDNHPINNGIHMAAHHLISAKGVELSELGSLLEHRGYDINELENLVYLPSTFEGACQLRVQLHKGDHTYALPGEKPYHDQVKAMVKKLKNQFTNCSSKIEGKNYVDMLMNEISLDLVEKISQFRIPLTSVFRNFKPSSYVGCANKVKISEVQDRVGRCYHDRNHQGQTHYLNPHAEKNKNPKEITYTKSYYQLSVKR
ncbi:AHH domain-containing protein [Flocculibacter collagenilyticus]|uniref:AHH domain-containing protein n=1 Tax=Flocculibacter collagenilyticus TaxID=2744479 RepID=UPI0018F583E7|nr:AHH domain-containing protein [Flocculibacter collagenilyticus]